LTVAPVTGAEVKESLFALPDISDFFSCHLRKNDYSSNYLYSMAKQIFTFVLLVAFVSAGCGQKDALSENYSDCCVWLVYYWYFGNGIFAGQKMTYNYVM